MKKIKPEHKMIGKLVKKTFKLVIYISIILFAAKVGLLGKNSGSILILFYGLCCIASMINDYNDTTTDIHTA